MEVPFCLCNVKGRRDVSVALVPQCYPWLRKEECLLEFLPESTRTLFRLRSGPSGRVVGLGGLPFVWKYRPYICLQN